MMNKLAPSSSSDDITVAKRVLITESKALEALAASLDHAFSNAVSTIQDMKDKGFGRLIVAGIGKSGHVARKIAATLASTGTPSYYIHPGEASHGDLGMIAQSDVIILLSNSGENSELSDIIAYAKRFDIPLIAMTSNKDGALAKHADITLLLPREPEACPNGLAPTTSTTMMMALGDALAIALLERMNLTAEQFRVFHPGGKLGQKLKRVSDFMIVRKDLAVVSPATKMDQALITLSEKNLGSVLIADDQDNLLGIITDGDLKRHMSPDLLNKSVSDIMSKNPRNISPDLLAVEALDMMINAAKTPITSLIVSENNKIIGMIRVQELLRAGIA
jgi:arabinose-5-phosphate isomerase